MALLAIVSPTRRHPHHGLARPILAAVPQRLHRCLRHLITIGYGQIRGIAGISPSHHAFSSAASHLASASRSVR
jgi:hypothetical protein